jgi:hypothetical protein
MGVDTGVDTRGGEAVPVVFPPAEVEDPDAPDPDTVDPDAADPDAAGPEAADPDVPTLGGDPVTATAGPVGCSKGET